MEFVKLTQENIGQEHICCAIANDKDIQVMSKKNWLKDRLQEGLVFLKGDVRGKCFIEYIPAEYAWIPIEANHFMYIDCLWVSGQFKGHGYSNQLLDQCIEDSKEKARFRNTVHMHENLPKGFSLYYTNQCPFTAKYVPMLENMAKARGIDFHVVHIQSREEAQNAPTPFTTFSLFYDGEFVTHEILSEKKFEKILVEKGVFI